MNYTKPQVAVLGQAVRVIESHNAKTSPTIDGTVPTTTYVNPAYDLDE